MNTTHETSFECMGGPYDGATVKIPDDAWDSENGSVVQLTEGVCYITIYCEDTMRYKSPRWILDYVYPETWDEKSGASITYH